MSLRVAYPLMLLMLYATPAAAQVRSAQDTIRTPGQIIGRIVDAATAQPISGVAVRITDLRLPAQISDAGGRFQLTSIPPGIYEIEFKHLTYGTKQQLVNVPEGSTVDLTVRLSAEPIALEGIVVEVELRGLATVGYYDRKRARPGSFFDRKDFERWELRQVMQQVPGVSIVSQGGSAFFYQVIFRQFGRPCIPELYIDNRHIRLGDSTIGDFISSTDIEALEVYRGFSTPAEFMPPGFVEPCGAVVIWTRHAYGQ